MYARSTTFRAQSSPIDADIAHVRDTVMPALEGIEGYIGLSLLVDRPSRRGIATSSWRSEEDLTCSSDSSIAQNLAKFWTVVKQGFIQRKCLGHASEIGANGQLALSH